MPNYHYNALDSTSSFNSTFVSSSSLTFEQNDTTRSSNSSAPNQMPDQIYIDILVNTRFWVQRIASPFVIVLGVIGNSMTIVIMTRKRMRSSTNVYLASLATVDMLYLTFTFILSLKHYPGINANPKSITRLYFRLLPILMMSADLRTNCSVWLTAAFTIEHFIVVSNPIRGKAMCTESRARKLCIFIFAFCLAFVIPTPFEWKVVEKIDKGQQILEMELSELGQNQTYKSIYYWLTSVLFIFVPLIFLIVFNSFLIRSVHISRKERAHMTNARSSSSTVKLKKSDTKQSKNKQKFVCNLKLDNNNNDNPKPIKPTINNTNNNSKNNLELNALPNLQSASDSNLQVTNEQQTNNLLTEPTNKNLLSQRRLSDSQSLESRRTSASASSPTTAAKSAMSSSGQTPNRIEQQSAKQENKITIMLISVVILFLVCQLPVAINLIYTSIRNLEPNTNELYIVTALNNILNLMVACNAAGNVILYSVFSKKYRIVGKAILKKMICSCRR